MSFVTLANIETHSYYLAAVEVVAGVVGCIVVVVVVQGAQLVYDRVKSDLGAAAGSTCVGWQMMHC